MALSSFQTRRLINGLGLYHSSFQLVFRLVTLLPVLVRMYIVGGAWHNANGIAGGVYIAVIGQGVIG